MEKWKSGEHKSVKLAAINGKTTESNIKTVSYIAKHGDEDWIDEIFNGDNVVYGTKTSNNIFTIKAYLAKRKAFERDNTYDKRFRKMTDTEIELLKKQIESALDGVDPLDVKKIANHVYRITMDRQ